MTTRWSGRWGMAACGEDRRGTAAVVRRGRVKIPRAHEEESIEDGVVCESLCVVSASEACEKARV